MLEFAQNQECRNKDHEHSDVEGPDVWEPGGDVEAGERDDVYGQADGPAGGGQDEEEFFQALRFRGGRYKKARLGLALLKEMGRGVSR